MKPLMTDEIVDTIKSLIARDEMEFSELMTERNPTSYEVRSVATSTAGAAVAERGVEGEPPCLPLLTPPAECREAREELNRARWIEILRILSIAHSLG